MTIIINDYQTSGHDTVDVVLPGSTRKWTIKSPDACTVGDIRRIAAGDIDFYIDLFPEQVRPLVLDLHRGQLNELITAWTASTGVPEAGKDSPASAG